MNKRTSNRRYKLTKPATVPIVGISSPPTKDAAPTRCEGAAKRGYVIAGGVIALLCSMLYVWTADFPMEFDDCMYLQNNPLVREGKNFAFLGDLREFSKRPEKEGFAPDLATNFILRPVAYATFHLNYLADEFRPRWYRLANIGIHGVNGLLVFALARLLLARVQTLPRRSEMFIPCTAALLFVAHPMATESVTYIIQRFTSLGTMFYLGALCLYFAAMSAETPGKRKWLRIAAVAAVIFGMLTKESVVTAPLVAVMLDWLVVRRHDRKTEEKIEDAAMVEMPWGERLLHWIRERSSLCKAIKEAWPLLLCLPIVPLFVLLAAWGRHGNEVTIGAAVNVTNLNKDPWDHWQYFITQFTVVMNYLRKLVWPSGLNLDPEWPLYESLLRGPVILAVEGIAIIIGVAVWLARRYHRDVRFSMVLAFVLWFFATIVVSSGLVPLPDLMAEHRSYLPSVGIFIAIACLFDWARCSLPSGGRWLATLAAAVAVGTLSIATVKRNGVWRSATSLWEDTVTKSPGNYRVWSNLGASYVNDGKLEKGVIALRKSVALNPKFDVAYLNLASALNGLHRPKEALEAVACVEKLNAGQLSSPDVLCAKSIALIESGGMDEGVRILTSIVGQVPTHRTSHMVLGLVYSQTNEHGKALKHFKEALRLRPGDPEVQALILKSEAVVSSR